MSQKGFDQMLAQRQKQMNNYFNCQSGAIKEYTDINQTKVSCPNYSKNPAVVFEFDFKKK